MLAETNGATPGRWVLVPRKGERFLGSRDRNRLRARRRRRQVFSVLLEATALTLLMGMFPPLRPMLLGTAVLLVLLVLYVALLVHIKSDEATKARLLATQRTAALGAIERAPAEAVRRAALEAGYGRPDREVLPYPNGHQGHHYVRGYGNGHVPYPNGHGPAQRGPGQAAVRGRASPLSLPGAEELLESGVRILDDVHVVVRRRVHAEREAPAFAR